MLNSFRVTPGIFGGDFSLRRSDMIIERANDQVELNKAQNLQLKIRWQKSPPSVSIPDGKMKSLDQPVYIILLA